MDETKQVAGHTPFANVRAHQRVRKKREKKEKASTHAQEGKGERRKV